eukprot:2379217-Amphidinium_carterae.1
MQDKRKHKGRVHVAVRQQLQRTTLERTHRSRQGSAQHEHRALHKSGGLSPAMAHAGAIRWHGRAAASDPPLQTHHLSCVTLDEVVIAIQARAWKPLSPGLSGMTALAPDPGMGSYYSTSYSSTPSKIKFHWKS